MKGINNYAFIFARGGSKGLPGKNIKSLGGKPLLGYSIETALACKSIDKIFVSTDDADIANAANNYPVVVIDRPSEYAQDGSSEWTAWKHAIKWVVEKYGSFENFISLPVTSPLRSIDDVENAVIKRIEKKADICISITPANRSPYFNMVSFDKQGFVELVNKPSSGIFRRQDAPEVFDITTVVYVASPDFIMNHESLFEGKVTSIEVPKSRAVDIDDIYDFKLAEVILRGER